MQLLDSSHSRERDKALLRESMAGGVWKGFLFGQGWGSEDVPCRFRGGWGWSLVLGVHFSSIGLNSSKILNAGFHEVSTMDKSQWPWCLLWHGWSHPGQRWMKKLPEIGWRPVWVLILLRLLLCWDPAHGCDTYGVVGNMTWFPNV